MRLIYIIVCFLIVTFIGLSIASDLNVSTVSNCKILHLKEQQIISGTKDHISTNIRFLIITNKGTFISESSFINGKFNNSDIFYRLEEGKVYNLKLCGFGKSFLFDYKNILDTI